MSPPDPQYQAALAIVRTLRAADHQAFFAGGCVRDLLLGLTPKDYDVATSATPDQIVPLFPKTFAVGAHFGVILVCTTIASTKPDSPKTVISTEPKRSGETCNFHPEAPNPATSEVTTEVATFRHDGAYSDGRRPDAVRFSTSPEEDVQRRDFTINGMLLDPLSDEPGGTILDFVGGRKDLTGRWIRTIGPAHERFAEDKLRMLRAIRFAARLGFNLYYPTAAAIQAQAGEIVQVSNERIRDELTRMLTEGHARRAFEMLDHHGLLPHILPEAVKMKGVPQPPEFHPEGDVWVHTMLLLEKLPAGCSATLAWGALLHDIGKPATYQPPQPTAPGEKPDRIRFNGHVEAGVRIAEVVLERLRFSNEDTAQILALVKNHMRFGDILHMKPSTLKRFLRLPRFDEHLALHYLDVTSAHGDLRLYDFALAQYSAEPEEAHRPAPLLTGADLIAAGYRPSPQFKLMLTLAEDAQLESSIHTREEALALVQSHFPRG